MAESYEGRLVYYSAAEELANRITHGVGALFSLAGLVVLVVAAGAGSDPRRIVGVAIFGTVLTAFYVISTLYHSVRSPRRRYLFRILDHAGIYLVIAATYTPFTLVSLRGAGGWWLFGTVWVLAAAGVVFKMFMTHRWRRVTPALYIGMGWLAVFAFEPLLAALTPAGMGWLIGGGIAYTSGVVFYAWDRIPYNHAIWHVFVLVGSACHFFAILWYVVPE